MAWVSARSMTSPCLLAFSLQRLDQHRADESAADANRCHAFLLAVFLQTFEKMQNDSRARGSDRMAERDCPAVHVQFAFVEGAEGFFKAELLLAVLLVLPGGEA